MSDVRGMSQELLVMECLRARQAAEAQSIIRLLPARHSVFDVQVSELAQAGSRLVTMAALLMGFL